MTREPQELNELEAVGGVVGREVHPAEVGGTVQAASPGAGALAGGGEMGRLVRAFDWSATPVGPAPVWPQSLRTAVSICLASRFPMLIWWGPHLIQIYNDGYRPVLGAKHPRSLGQPGPECWAEIWDVIGPLCDQVRSTGDSTWSEDLLLVMERHGYVEETYFTFSYSAIRDESGSIGGVLVTCVETTERVLGERRVGTLRELAESAGDARTVEDACRMATRTLEANPHDVPFALIYLIAPDGASATLAGAAGLTPGTSASPLTVSLDGSEPTYDGWPLQQVAHGDEFFEVDDVVARFGALPSGPWANAAGRALVLPIARPGQTRPAGVLVAGVSPARELDEGYRGFLELVAGHIAAAIASASAYEEERRRAEALAELDRAKTVFFANVSHEFRTPLALMLAPLEDLLAQPGLSSYQRETIQLVHRNALRLLKLVNTLLDFSRIEAGRLRAVYEPTDLAALTSDLASVFRSAVERAGLRLIVNAGLCPEPVFVDRDMWEKIVLNLLSNAFKHTFEGEIEVALEWGGDHVTLAVRDTGTGIPEDEVPFIFDRFHRGANQRSRTHEGAGIGLALVHELVRLHGGVIDVDTRVGHGTTMRLRVPTGTAHLPPDRIADARAGAGATPEARAFVEEALRWLPGEDGPPTRALTDATAAVDRSSVLGFGETGAPTHGERVLVADDNADMRQYLVHLLSAHWDVVTAADGVAALEAVREAPPDLVLADVMMPGLDGFGLLRELRGEPETRTIPVILLSARAGEEARVEGLAAGADDYVLKPFNARELVARVGGALDLARVRREAAERERAARAEAEKANRVKGEFLAMMSHELRTPLNAILGFSDLLDAEVAGPLTAAQREHLGRIRASARHLTQIIEEILSFSRIEAGQEIVHAEHVEVAGLVRETAAIIEPLARVQGLRLVVDAPAGARSIVTDGGKLRQILLNLLSNAVKFTPAGTVRLEASFDGDSVAFAVSDTGVGIAADQLERIFEPFRQVERRGGAPGGTGLGLAVCRHLARLLGGDITVRSTPGVGSTFRVVLPVRPARGTVTP